MAMMSANTNVEAMRRPRGVHRIARAVVTRALPGRAHALLAGFAAFAGHRGKAGYAVPDTLRADVGLPPVEREMRRHWEVR